MSYLKIQTLAPKKTKFTEARIGCVRHQADTGITVAEGCRQMGISEATTTTYNRKKKHGGLGVPERRRLQQSEQENQHLKQVVADLGSDKQLQQHVLRKKF